MDPPPVDDESTLPRLSDMPLHEWIGLLTHPVSGPYPRGLTTRMMDSLVRRSGVVQFPSADRRRYHSLWKTIGHFAVYLSEAARKGRIRRISLGTYIGVFDNAPAQVNRTAMTGRQPDGKLFSSGSSREQSTPNPITYRSSTNKRKSSLPQRYLNSFVPEKRVCNATSPDSDMPKLEEAVTSYPSGQSTTASSRPPSCDSIDGGSGSSTDDSPVDQQTLNHGLMTTKNAKSTKPKREKPNSWSSFLPSTTNKTIQNTGVTTDKSGTKITITKKHCWMQPRRPEKKKDQMDDFGLPTLANLDPSLKDVTMSYLRTLTSTDVARLCQKMGFEEGAKAFTREEVDGIALMLLTREDVMNNLGLKLGPALKLHRFVRTLQKDAKGCARSGK